MASVVSTHRNRIIELYGLTSGSKNMIYSQMTLFVGVFLKFGQCLTGVTLFTFFKVHLDFKVLTFYEIVDGIVILVLVQLNLSEYKKVRFGMTSFIDRLLGIIT